MVSPQLCEYSLWIYYIIIFNLKSENKTECFTKKIRKGPPTNKDIKGYSGLSASEKKKVMKYVYGEGDDSSSDESSSSDDDTPIAKKLSFNSNSVSSKIHLFATLNLFQFSVFALILIRTRKRKRRSDSDEDSDDGPSKKRRKRSIKLSNSQIDRMGVKELKEYCKKLDLSSSGLKAVIQQRLKDYFKAEKKKPKQNKSELKKKIAADKKKYDKIIEDLRGYKNDELKAMLSKNFVKKSGNKSDLIERIADCKMYGKYPDCPSCGGGKLSVTYPQKFGHDGQGQWKCKGFMDDDQYRHCGFRSNDSHKRPKWKD